MNRIAVIATHHKCGTVWMNHTFRRIGEGSGIPVVNVGRDEVVADPAPPVIFCAANSKLDKYPNLLGHADARAFHVVRDPRDVLISAMHYHRTAEEKWLLRSSDELGGRTYRESLNARKTERERYVFEMTYSTKTIVRSMLRWDRDAPNSFEAKYEDLSGEGARTVFAAALAHLGFAANEVGPGVDIFWRNSIFGGLAGQKDKIPHVRSGEAGQWRAVFDQALGRAFAQRFADALLGLGYETGNAWIDALPALLPALDTPDPPQV